MGQGNFFYFIKALFASEQGQNKEKRMRIGRYKEAGISYVGA